jgi:Primase C terminal 2 (PriCT-2)
MHESRGMSVLDADRGQIANFVDALFRHAKDGTMVSLRAFAAYDKPWRTDLWRWVRLGRDRAPLIDAAVALATQCANAAIPVVFCPPVATFREGRKADEEHLSDGLVLSVECDAQPNEARVKLEELLGPAAVIVASGGEWTDPATGEIHDKLHLHWRLVVPARTPEEHKDLKLARRLAQMIVGADATGVPLVHPLRWPGSWHRKGQPRLARIVGGDPERETMLAEALMILRDAVGEIDDTPHRSGEPQASIERLEAAMLVLPNADRHWEEWNKFGMALFVATGGSDEGLELFERWSAKSAKYKEAATMGALGALSQVSTRSWRRRHDLLLCGGRVGRSRLG